MERRAAEAGYARVSARGATRWRVRRHPWIYRSDVVARPDSAAGPVAVQDERGRPLGMALWSPSSQISLRMLTREACVIDTGFWRERIGAAAAYRRGLAPDATAYRLVHGEADGVPSLVVDRYGEHLVVQLLSAGLEAVRAEVLAALTAELQPAGVLARNDVAVRAHERLEQGVELLYGEVPQRLEVREGAIRYHAALWDGQKTGAFLDQRENRTKVAAFARGRALDCFSYHGSFALHLAAAAQETIALDSSAAALERARGNAALNGFTQAAGADAVRHAQRGARLAFIAANAFDWLRDAAAASERFDTIVLDPPAFAKRKDALPAALRGYKELNLRALKLLAPGGHLCTYSCSFHLPPERFRAMLADAVHDAGRSVRWIEWHGQARDHPEIVQIPESAYLKGAVLQVVE
jgi:23S rRNA (cytosine1962-C5)-methyltransferase